MNRKRADSSHKRPHMVSLCAPIRSIGVCEQCSVRTLRNHIYTQIKWFRKIQWEYYYCYCQFENQKQRLQWWCARIDQNLLMALLPNFLVYRFLSISLLGSCSFKATGSFYPFHVDGWMDGCMNGWMDGCMDGCLCLSVFHFRRLYFSKSTTCYICLVGFIFFSGLKRFSLIFENLQNSKCCFYYIMCMSSFL